MVKPHQVLFTLLAIGGLCAILMLVFPREGIQISPNITLKFANFENLFHGDSSDLDVKDLLNQYEADSAAVQDSLAKHKLSEKQKLLWLQYGSTTQGLPEFYQSLVDLKSGNRKKIRILHYGDSQIEGDRITSYVREKLQSEFGGHGPGMLPAFEFVPNFSVQQTQSSNWIRYTAFGRPDTTVTHKNFGLAANFSRFTPYSKDTAEGDLVSAWVKFSPSKYGYGRVKRYNLLRVHYGNSSRNVTIQVDADGVLIHESNLEPTNRTSLFELNIGQTPRELTITFTGTDSPDLYGISLESSSGVILDNYAMRGSSGTVFTQMSAQHLSAQYNREPVSLVILQFGGNTVPYIKSKEQADAYGQWFGKQIAYLKKLIPNASFVVIGPSDMATKVGTQYQTMSFLVEVRDALKEASFKQGAAYWDIYEVMGGRNSMPKWVAEDPPLAAPDYIHFTPQGAKYVAELFYKSLHRDYERFLQNIADEKKIEDTAKKEELYEN